MIRGKRGVMALIGAACGLIAVVASGGAAGSTGPSQIRITDVELSDRVIAPAKGGRAGTIETIRQQLYNPRRSKHAIGRSLIVCISSDGRDRMCTGSYILPKGTLVVTGALQTRLLYELPVVGGTGLFDNARGTLTVTASHFRPRHEVLFFRLVG
jgi:Dirigent-like protein